VGWRLPKDMDADGFRRHLVHKGVLQERSGDICFCPIPSFRSFLIEYGQEDRPRLEDMRDRETASPDPTAIPDPSPYDRNAFG